METVRQLREWLQNYPNQDELVFGAIWTAEDFAVSDGENETIPTQEQFSELANCRAVQKTLELLGQAALECLEERILPEMMDQLESEIN